MFGRKNEKIVLTKTPSTVFVAVAFNGTGYMPYCQLPAAEAAGS
ncbi:MAG: hypothetical protein SOI52_05830 [Erysipelotrichaceae bacterium]|jgi:hypothetical protein